MSVVYVGGDTILFVLIGMFFSYGGAVAWRVTSEGRLCAWSGVEILNAR